MIARLIARWFPKFAVQVGELAKEPKKEPAAPRTPPRRHYGRCRGSLPRFTASEVASIQARLEAGSTQKVLAAELGTSEGTISRIANDRYWPGRCPRPAAGPSLWPSWTWGTRPATARGPVRSEKSPRVVGLRVKTGPGHLDTTGFVLREPYPL